MKEVENKIGLINALNNTLSLLYEQSHYGFHNEELIEAVEKQLLIIVKGEE